MARYTACVATSDPASVARSFEDDIISQSAINPKCKGASIGRYFGPPSDAMQSAIDRPHWMLTINFYVGAPVQSWSLNYDDFKGSLLHNHHEGEGATAAKIADDICSIVMGHGAKVIQ